MKIKRKTFWGGIVAALCACTALTFGAAFASSGIDNKVSAEAAVVPNLKNNITLTATPYYYEKSTGNTITLASMGNTLLSSSSAPTTTTTSVTYGQTAQNTDMKCVYFDLKVNVPVPAWEEWKVSYSLSFTLGADNTTSGTFNQAAGVYYFKPDTTTFDENYGNTTLANSGDISLTGYSEPKSGTGYYCNGKFTNRGTLSHNPTLYSNAATPTTKSTLTLSNKSGNLKTFTFSYGMFVCTTFSTTGTKSKVANCNVTLTADDVDVVELSSVPTVDKTEATYNAGGNIFNFTYDRDKTDYTVSYNDGANNVSDVTSSCTIDNNGNCTLTNAGTYTFSFNLKPTFNGVWVTGGRDPQQFQVTINKTKVDVPEIVGDSSKEYNNGDDVEFSFIGATNVNITSTGMNSAESGNYCTLSATAVGKYYVTFSLKDDINYEWSTGGTANKTMSGYLEVTPKTATLSASVDGGAWSWERKTTQDVEITVSGVVAADLPNLTINAIYSKDGVPKTIGTATYDSGNKYKVTIPSISQIATYTLTLTLADGGNYALATPFTQTFNITGTVPPFNDQYIVWQYTVDGKKTQLNDFVYDGDVVLVEYTGSEYTFSVDENDLQIYGLKVKANGYDGQSATNVKAADNGIYTMTVSIEAADQNTVFDDVFTLQFKIMPKQLTFDNPVLEYNDGSGFKPYSANSKPSYTGNSVDVRISPVYMASLGLAAGDYTENYIALNDPTEQGQKTTNAEITITNANFTTADGSGYVIVPCNWEITARALTYSWATQSVEVGGQSFDIPAITFDDGTNYSQYYEYIYTVDGTDYTYEQLKEYIAANWTETTPVSGTVRVQMKDGVTEVNIPSGSRSFTTGTPKTALAIAVTGSGAEYGKVEFAISVLRGTADESRRTEVTISGGALESEQTFDGDDTELIKYLNKLGAGSYTITVTLKSGNEDSYVLTQSVFEFEVLKCNVQLPTVREIVFTGETINLIDYLDGFDSSLMKLIGAAEGENGIISGRDYRKSGYFTTIALIDGANYQFVKAAESSEAETVKATLKFAVEFADGEEVLGSEYEINWMINRFRITEDMWDKSGKQGATLKLPAQFAAMAADENLLKISYSYYDDQNGAALEEYTFKGGNSFWVSATLTGEEANNFEFENGLQISDKTVYTVPQSKTEAFFNNTMTFVKNNMILVIGCAAGLLLLILLIIIIACAARSRKKKREREELAEQRRLEKEEREREERKLEREERMARMSQQQMMMPQMMPQGMPQAGGHLMAMGGGSSGSVSEAQFQQMQAELAELKAEKVAKDAAQQQIAQAKADVQFAGFMAQLMGGGSMDKLTEIIRTEVRNALADERAAQAPEHKAEEAKETTPVCPPDAVMTTVTTTKIDTTKKAQTADRAAAQPAPAARTVVRNLVAPMPVDDGRVFDVGGFYTPADPVTDMGSGEEDKD